MCWGAFLFVHFTRSILLHIHISNASSRFCSFRRSVQVSTPYNATLHTKLFTCLFLGSFSKGPQKMLLFLLEASYASAFLCFTSWQFMLILILHPKYLKLSTCSTDSYLIRISIIFGFLPITMVFFLYLSSSHNPHTCHLALSTCTLESFHLLLAKPYHRQIVCAWFFFLLWLHLPCSGNSSSLNLLNKCFTR